MIYLVYRDKRRAQHCKWELVAYNITFLNKNERLSVIKYRVTPLRKPNDGNLETNYKNFYECVYIFQDPTESSCKKCNFKDWRESVRLDSSKISTLVKILSKNKAYISSFVIVKNLTLRVLLTEAPRRQKILV